MARGNTTTRRGRKFRRRYTLVDAHTARQLELIAWGRYQRPTTPEETEKVLSLLVNEEAERLLQTQRNTAMRTFTLTTTRNVTATDLAEEFANYADAELFVVTIYDETGTQREAEVAEALYVPSERRMGIAWGANATWANVTGVEAGVEMWLNDPTAWEAAN